MKRFIAAGILFGFGLGIIVTFLFPETLHYEFYANMATKEQLYNKGFRTYKPISSVTQVGYVLPFVFGFIGGVAGIVIGKLKNRYSTKTE